MKKRTSAAAAEDHGTEQQHEGQPTGAVVEQFPAGEQPAGEQESSNEPVAPPRLNGEVQQCVDSVASTITGCSETELKNFLATTDFVVSQVALQLANRWKEICRTAEAAGGTDGEKAAKVGISFKVEIDHTNLNLMSTKVKMGFARKYSESAETQEDLRQVTFNLKSG